MPSLLRSLKTPLVALAVLLVFITSLPLPVLAEVIDTAGAKPGTYLLTIDAQGKATVAGPTNLVRLKDLGGPTNPQPPDDPPPTADTPLKAAVRKLTREAIDRGGSPETAAKFAAVYAIVSDDCLAGKFAPSVAPPLITAASDAILKDASDKDAWPLWRAGISAEVGKVSGIGTDKAATATALAEVSSAIKQSLNQQVEPGILDRIDWTRIIELIRPIIQEQLIKLLNDLLERLPK